MENWVVQAHMQMCFNQNVKKWWSTLENSTGGSFTHNQMSALSLPQFRIQCYASRWFPQALWTWVLVQTKYLHRVCDGWAAKVSHISGSGCVREKNERGRCSLCDPIPQTISIYTWVHEKWAHDDKETWARLPWILNITQYQLVISTHRLDD